MKTMNTALVRAMNYHSVRRQLMTVQSATKAQLAAATGLSPMTVGTIIAGLQKLGEVCQLDEVPSNGGRPSVRYGYNRFYALSMIVYGHQKDNKNLIHMRLVDMLGHDIVSQERYIENVTQEALEMLMERGLAAAVDKLGHKYPENTGAPASDSEVRQRLRVIGFGLPGVEQDGKIISNDYPQLVGTDVIAYFSKKYGASVQFFNDINAAVYGYYDRERLPAKADPVVMAPAVAGIYYPRLYYPGMGLVIDGKIYCGRQNFAGEIGGLLANAADRADWLQVDYHNRDQVASYIARDLYFISCVLAPDRIVLYGDFLDAGQADQILERAEKLLGGRFIPQLEIAHDFEADFDRGLRVLTKDHLYRTVFPLEEAIN